MPFPSGLRGQATTNATRRCGAATARRTGPSSTGCGPPACTAGQAARRGRARRENVSFHTTCAAAERAGFRACKRCRPNEASQAKRQAETVRRACRLIDAAEDAPALADIARRVGVSPFHFHRLFKQATGVTPKAYAAARRAARLQDGLGTADSVTEAIYEAGFNAPSRFYEGRVQPLGHDPRRLPQGRDRRGHPFRRGPMLARRHPGRRDGKGHLRHRVRRRPRHPGARPAGPFPESRPPRRRPGVRSHGGPGRRPRRGRPARRSTSRSTSAAPRSSSACGKPCARCRLAPPRATATSPPR